MIKKSDFLYDMWAFIYTLFIMIISAYNINFGIISFFVLFLLALPFIKSPEHYFCISLFLSTVSYYFFGAYEGIISIYTILVIIIFINKLLTNKLHFNNKKSMISMILLCFLALISYKFSPFGYLNGLLKFLYIVIVSLLIGNFGDFDNDKLLKIIPKIACVMVIGYIIIILMQGSYVNGRLTISKLVNTNTFGKSCALIVTSLFLAYYFNRKNKIYFIMSFVMVIIEFMSGSRGALLAIIASIILTILFITDKKGQFLKKFFKVTILVFIFFAVFSISTKVLNINTSRFDISSTIDSGGNNRTLIYNKIIPYVLENGYWKFGYGPGHDCTRRIIISLIYRDYTHAHNTFIEAFGELGIFGLILTIMCYTTAFNEVIRKIKINKQSAILLGMIFCILINGMVESYFCYITMWLILAICRNSSVLNIYNKGSD